MKPIATIFLVILCNCNLYAQHIGIGTDMPKARLHVADSSVLFSADGVQLPGSPGLPPISGAGRRMMWYADKAAFRTGAVSSTQWDQDKIGNYSFAGGLSSYASGVGSMAYGGSNSARADFAISMGQENYVTGMAAAALGSNNSITKAYAFSAGYGNTVTGNSGVALGTNNDCREDYSVTVGSGNITAGRGAVAVGTSNFAHGDYSFAGSRNSTASSFNETTFGQYNTDYITGSRTEWVGTDRLFVIGNGTSSANKSNALTVFKNGNIGIMTHSPNARLSVNGDASKTGGGVWAAWSDARLKKNITPYNAGLKEILQINPVRFQYNELSGEEDLDKNYVGIIAQEIEKILPSTISIKKDDKINDKRMFDGSELTYTLINAVKEQQGLIEQQQQQLKKQQQKIEILINEIEGLKKLIKKTP